MANTKSIVKTKEAKEIKNSLMLSGSPLNVKQLMHMLQRTPKEHIYKRVGKGGGEFEYVTGTYMKKVLNYMFGWMWDFEVKSHGQEKDLVWVLGRLTMHYRNTCQPAPAGRSIRRNYQGANHV